VITGFEETVYGVTIESETINGGILTVSELRDKINDVRLSMSPGAKGIKVGTADTWNSIVDRSFTTVLDADIDLILANSFPYWMPSTDALGKYLSTMNQTLQHVDRIRTSDLLVR
jgi:exo-beta-1,3-glucanase (GH17 family)